MVNKSIGIILMVMIITAIITAAGFGCNKSDKGMNGADNMTTAIPKIPPIDKVAPVKTETATFALG
jgi:hypothetical protein